MFILINSYSDLTDEFIRNLPDPMFRQTLASMAFQTKDKFIFKIQDKATRLTMLKSIVQCRSTAKCRQMRIGLIWQEVLGSVNPLADSLTEETVATVETVKSEKPRHRYSLRSKNK